MTRLSPRRLLLAPPLAGGPTGPSAWPLALAVLLLLALAMAGHLAMERRRRERIRRHFRRFNPPGPKPGSELRGGERLAVPAALHASVTLTDGEWFGLHGRITDISATGLGIKPDFPLKRVPLDVVLNNVLVNTPLNHFVIRQARTVRIEHQVQKRLLGLQLLAVDDDQRCELQRFQEHLHAFLRHERTASTG